MQTAHQLFLHELGDILNAERNLVDALAEQADSVTDEQLKKAIADHRAQTEKQVERLEQVFEDLGEEAEEAECKGVKGLVEEWKSFKEEEDPSDDILNVVTISAAAKVESYEINAYESLIQMAQDMDHTKAVKLLQQNLKEEQQTLKKMQSFAKKIKPELSGMEEEEVDSESEEQGSGRSRSKKSTARRGRKAA
jgi:ferritin-like metal-binding protein YciE